MHRNLRSFLDLLRRENDLLTIDAEVDPYLELAEIHRRVIQESGPALLFKRVKGSRFPVVTNLFGTPQRIELAFGLHRKSNHEEAQPRDLSHAGLRRRSRGSALADSKRRGLSLSRS